MAKDKNTPLGNDRMMSKIIKEIERQGLQSETDIQSFLNGIMGKNIDELDFGGEQSNEDKANNLIEEAYNSSFSKGKKLIAKALKLDPDSADAYNYLGDIQDDYVEAIRYYEEGMKAGMRKLGEDFFEKNMGHCWVLIQTRPFMRSKQKLAECLTELEIYEGAFVNYMDLLALNPNDNQGVRYELSTILLLMDELKLFSRLIKDYPDEITAHWTYNIVLYHLKKQKTLKARKELQKAVESNPHVIDYLLDKKRLPKELPDYMGFGDESEAIVYASKHKQLWKEIKGAKELLQSIQS